jgi:hypothetical protein
MGNESENNAGKGDKSKYVSIVYGDYIFYSDGIDHCFIIHKSLFMAYGKGGCKQY